MDERTEMTTMEEIETNEDSGMGTGLAMLIGSGLTLAAIVGGKKLKKAWDKRKAKKEKEVVDSEVVYEEDCEEETTK